MNELLLTLQEPWAIRALITSSMVGIMCGALGCFIVLRNMSLIGDALSHAILPGIFVAFLIFGYSTIGFFIGSTLAGLLSALFISWIQQNVNTKNDAAIGIIFTSMFAIGIIGISWLNQSQGVHLDLKDFLFGNILGISNEDIYLTIGVTLYTMLSIIIFYRYLFITTFQATIADTMGISVKTIHYYLMLLLSFAVVASLRSVGVILVVAMLITPAATALLVSNELKKVIIISSLIGLVSAVSGLILSIVFMTAPGPAMTLMATFFYFLAVIFAPEKGLLFKFLRNQKERRKIIREDILKAIFKSGSNPISDESIRMKLGISKWNFKMEMNDLRKKKFIRPENKATISELSERGKLMAEKLVRAHRIWETYQVDQMGLENHQIHNDAERMEHKLSSDIIDQIDKELGFPVNDPHGSPIPQIQIEFLNQIPLGKEFKILKEQSSESIESILWDLGISHSDTFRIGKKRKNSITVELGQKRINVPFKWASSILVEKK